MKRGGKMVSKGRVNLTSHKGVFFQLIYFIFRWVGGNEAGVSLRVG